MSTLTNNFAVNNNLTNLQELHISTDISKESLQKNKKSIYFTAICIALVLGVLAFTPFAVLALMLVPLAFVVFFPLILIAMAVTR